MCLATRVGLLRRHLGQNVTDTRLKNGFKNRLTSALTGIVQKISQQDTEFDFIQSPQPYEWHPEFLEPSQAAHAKIQWCSKGSIWSMFERM